MNWLPKEAIAEKLNTVLRRKDLAFENLRKSSLAKINAAEWPSMQMELWKNLDLKPLYKSALSLNVQNSAATFSSPIDLSQSSVILFTNGTYLKDRSTHLDPQGIQIQEISEVVNPQQLEHTQDNIFLDLNTATFETGFHIVVEKNYVAKHPVVIVYQSTDSKITSYKNFIHLREGSCVEIIELFLGQDEIYLNTAFTHTLIDPNAHLKHSKLQTESLQAFHIGGTVVSQEKNSTFKSMVASFGARVARSDTLTVLHGDASDCHLQGLYFGSGEQTLDHFTSIDHATAHTTSNELYKGILNDESRGGFSGKIIVRKDAQKIDSKQLTRNLLLSKNALADTLPQLEIFANDVKCSHGATIGELSDEEVFYLRSRGLSLAQAKRELVMAFAGESLDFSEFEPLKKYILSLIERKMSFA